MQRNRVLLLAVMLVTAGWLIAGSSAAVAQSDTGVVAQTNASANATAELDAEVEADRLRDEADRLYEELLDTVVEEINLQAEERLGMEIDPAEPVSTPDEARAEADRLLNSQLHAASPDEVEEAAQGLNDAADSVERINQSLTQAADELESADDPYAEAERIDAEVIGEINAGLRTNNTERFVQTGGVQLVDPILEDVEQPDLSDDGGADTDGGNESDDEGSGGDSMGSPFVALTGVIAVAITLITLARRT